MASSLITFIGNNCETEFNVMLRFKNNHAKSGNFANLDKKIDDKKGNKYDVLLANIIKGIEEVKEMILTY
jgi:hypothetical protein